MVGKTWLACCNHYTSIQVPFNLVHPWTLTNGGGIVETLWCFTTEGLVVFWVVWVGENWAIVVAYQPMGSHAALLRPPIGVHCLKRAVALAQLYRFRQNIGLKSIPHQSTPIGRPTSTWQ